MPEDLLLFLETIFKKMAV